MLYINAELPAFLHNHIEKFTHWSHCKAFSLHYITALYHDMLKVNPRGCQDMTVVWKTIEPVFWLSLCVTFKVQCLSFILPVFYSSMTVKKAKQALQTAMVTVSLNQKDR